MAEKYQYIVWITPGDDQQIKNVMRLHENDDPYSIMDEMREDGIVNIHLQNSPPEAPEVL
jgi:hypothetical protein